MKKKVIRKEFSTLKLHLLKLVSLLTAFLIWFYVLNSEPMSVEIKMGIKVKTPAGIAVGSKLPTSIGVKVQGPRVFIRNLKAEEQNIFLQVKADMNQLPIKKRLVIKESGIRLPLGISVESISPKYISMTLEKKIKKYVPIIANFVGVVDPHYRLIKKSLDQNKILIEGPLETMRKVTKVYTKPIDLSLINKSGQMVLALVNTDNRVQMKKKTVVLSYTLRPKTANLLLKKIKIRFLSSSQNITTKNHFASLSVLVEEGKESMIKKNDVQVIADIPEGRKGKFSVSLSAKLPDNIHMLEIFPAKIKVNVR